MFLSGSEMLYAGGTDTVVSDFRFVDSATSTGATIIIPSGTQPGDLMVGFDLALNISGFPTAVFLFLGLTINNTTGAAHRNVITASIADSSSAGSTITGMDGTSSDRKIILVFRPRLNSRIRELVVGNVVNLSSQITTANPGAQSLSLAARQTPVIAFASYNATGAVTTRTFTGATQDGEIANGTTNYVKYVIYSQGETPADISVDMDDNGTNVLASFGLQFNPG